MKLQSASRKEIARISLGVLVCDGIMVAGLFLLSQFGVGSFDLGRILLGAACGSAVAILNFVLLCITVQSAVDIGNKRKMKARFQLSYNLRMAMNACWVVAAFLIPQVHFLAGAAPVLFPNVVLIWLQTKGRLVTPGTASAPSDPEDEEPEDRLNSFEV